MSLLAMPTVNNSGENVFKLTSTGLVSVAVLIALFVIIAIILRPKKAGNIAAMATTQLVFSAAAMALAIVTAEIKFTQKAAETLKSGTSMTTAETKFSIKTQKAPRGGRNTMKAGVFGMKKQSARTARLRKLFTNTASTKTDSSKNK